MVPQSCIDLIKKFEGCKLTAYQDIVGIWTIGYGETLNVHPGMTWTQAQADDTLSKRLQQFYDKVKSLITMPATENMFSALTCFAYNVGIGALKGSTLLKCVNKGDSLAAAEQFLVWNKAGGKPISGLTRRREAERSLFLS